MCVFVRACVCISLTPGHSLVTPSREVSRAHGIEGTIVGWDEHPLSGSKGAICAELKIRISD